MTDTLKQIYGDLEDLGKADRYLDEILEIVHQIKLFDDFSMDEIKVLCHYMQCFAAPRNYTLLEEGTDGDYLLLILTGSVEVRKQIPGQGVEMIAEMTAGSTMGEMSLVDGKPHYTSCIARVPTDFAVLTREALNGILLQAPRLGNKLLLILLQMMSTQLRQIRSPILPSVT